MEEDYSKMVRLILYSFTGSLSEEEQKELDAWINARDYRRREVEALRRQGVSEEWGLSDNIDKSALWEKMQAEVAARQGAPPLPPPNPFRDGLIAAAVLILLIAGFLVFSGPKDNAVPVPAIQLASLFYNDEPAIHLSADAGKETFRKGIMNMTHRDGKLIVKIDYKRSPAADRDRYKVATPRGGKYDVLMPDSSGLNLNVASDIKFVGYYGASQREIDLEEGEVFFYVNSKVNEPFVVHVRNLTMTATGTSFNIRAYTEDSSVRATLLSGSLQVQRTGDSVDLKPGQIYVLNPDGSSTVEGKPYSRAVIPWKQNLFTFRSEPVGHVLEEIGRWYNATVEYKEPVSGHISLELPRTLPLKKLLDQVFLNLNYHYTISGNRIIISR